MTSSSERGPRRSLWERAQQHADAQRQSEHDASRRTSGGELVFLIGIDARHSRPHDNAAADEDASDTPRGGAKITTGGRAARNEAEAVSENAKPSRTREFSSEESLAELRELAISAGATMAGEFLRYRDRLDPATLVGKGKLEEIAR